MFAAHKKNFIFNVTPSKTSTSPISETGLLLQDQPYAALIFFNLDNTFNLCAEYSAKKTVAILCNKSSCSYGFLMTEQSTIKDHE